LTKTVSYLPLDVFWFVFLGVFCVGAVIIILTIVVIGGGDVVKQNMSS